MKIALHTWLTLTILFMAFHISAQQSASRITYFPDSLSTTSSDSLWVLDATYLSALQDSVLSDLQTLRTEISGPLQSVQDTLRQVEGNVQHKVGEVKQKADQLQDKIRQKTSFQIELISAEDGGFEEVGDASLQVDSPLPQVDIPGVPSGLSSDQAIAKAKNLATEQLSGLGIAEDHPLLQQSGEIKQRIQALSSGQMPDAAMADGLIENKVQSLAEVGGLQEVAGGFGEEFGIQDVGQVKDLMSPEKMRERALQEARKRAVDHLAGRGKEVQAAQAQMSKLKSSYSSVNSAKDLPKRKPNQMKDKPFRERFIPGVGVEVFTSQSLRAVDFSHQLSYRLTGKVTTGISFVYRLHIGQDYLPYMTHSYAGRWHADYGIRKGFFARVEAEMYKTVEPLTGPGFFKSSEISTWYPALYTGFGKNYKFVKKIKGQVVIHYNWLYQFQESPYPSKVNVRTHFNFKIPAKKVKVVE